ncbi:AAA family ATPase [Allocoleopsis sp.]|uniref:AAA family ATPase n=1 Tax=Allocoleopsis sp. TaxID=3088169 RepID=UPI002FD4F305
MIQLDGYQILNQIYDSANSMVYRGIWRKSKQSVILKVLKEDYPTPQELTRYKQEYEISRNLNIDGVVKAYSLQPYQRTLVIILEDFGASSLKELMNVRANRCISLAEFISLAIKVTESLAAIHTSNVIHKDINPSNIVLNPQTGQLKIIDFGIATVLTRENPTLKNPNVLEGTLAYMSPEQTGRMNRSLDYRTDFYSLGITFYELLTGRLPFETSDALELVHCHIAKVPMPPHQLNAEIPLAVSDIVMKLIAKTAEERYQSAWGIKYDLEQCLFQLQTKGTISSFTLATKDISDKFQIPQKLYGREAEVETLLTAFERVAGGDKGAKLTENSALSSTLSQKSQIEMMLVAGYSGIGKSSLVAEIHKPNTRLRGYFTWGKFDQFQRNVPYSAIVSAFKGLVRQLLTETEAQLNQWRTKLSAAFGSNGQVIIDVIPEVELIVGKQPPVPELGPTESQNRFNLIFSKFIRAFCTQEHPLVIFLDDLQWADSATLKLIELIMTDADMQYLFLIGAYRDNEVSPAHPLMMTLDGLCHQGAIVNSITLSPLELEHTTQLIADTLHIEAGLDLQASNLRSQDTRKPALTVKPLAELVKLKTGGNPFFVNQFLKTLHTENLITFDFQNHGWQWDIAQIEAQNITDNVVELMVGKLKKLSESTQQVLRLASCVGASFDLNTISIVCEKSKEGIFPDLVMAIQSGLILPTSELDQELLIQDYKFLHDRVQQAAYALIDENRKKAVHLQIGRLLLANVSAEELPEKLFEIVDHLNLGLELITDESELVELARLNLEAGKKAKSSTAYSAALAQYFTPGIEVLSGDIWHEHYELTFNLYRERSECEYLCGNFDTAEELFDLILTQANSNLDRAEIQNIRLVLYDNTGKFLEAVHLGAKALKSLGLSLPTTNKAEILSELELELQLYRTYLEKIKIAELIDAPEMSNPEIRACMKLLMNITGPAYFVDQDLLALISLKMVNLSLEHGNSEVSAHGYAFWGFLAGARLIDYEVGYEFGQLSMQLNEKFNNVNLVCKIFNMFGGLINPWRDHLKKGIPFLRNGYLSGLETGDVYISYNSYHLILQRILSAENFSSILDESYKHLEFLKQIKNHVFAGIQQLYQHLILNLQGLTLDKFSFNDEDFDEGQCLQMWQENGFMTGVAPYNIFKAQVLFLYGDYEKALHRSRKSDEIVVFISGVPSQAEHYLYYSLILTALYPTASPAQQNEYGEILKANQQKLKIWADNCPENFLHKYLLVEAEIARISDQGMEAIDLYDQAIASARENEYIQNEALGNELAAKFWLGKGKEEIAQLYMKKAHYGYQLWGAKRKVEDLEEKYPQLLPQLSSISRITSIGITTTNTSTGSRSASALDLATFMKATQAISGEIKLDNLLSSLMRILIENAGAQTGHLILETQGRLQIEASGKVDSDNITVLQSVPISNRLPAAIVNYVARTKETVVLNDAISEGNFTNDSYIKQHQIKSILCAPLVNQGQLSGIVYLENNLTAGAFTSERLEVLQLLSGQAAIAITNAKLYAEVTESERRLTQFFEAMPMGVSVHEPTGQTYYTNQRAQELMGINVVPQAESEQLSLAYQVYRTETKQLYPTEQLPIVRSLKGERVKVDDIEFHQPDRIIPVEVYSTPIFDETGKIVYAIAAFQDITERKQAEKLIAEYNRTLEEQVKERTAQLAEANKEIMALNKRLKADNLRMSAELEVTKQLQQMILPKSEELEVIEGLEIAGFMEPADEVGGDYYDILQHDGKVKIGIGDVTGHGLESGVLMLMTQTAVRTLQESNQTDPVQFLDILNRTIYRNAQRINPNKNLTLALLDYADGTLNVSGQHEEIIVVRVGGEVERMDTRFLGFPIGLDEEIADFIASEQVQLNPGDVVVLYTDGITEAFDINNQQYGLEQLCEVVSQNCDRTAQEIREAVIEDVRRHIGTQKVFDDITLVVLKQK